MKKTLIGMMLVGIVLSAQLYGADTGPLTAKLGDLEAALKKVDPIAGEIATVKSQVDAIAPEIENLRKQVTETKAAEAKTVEELKGLTDKATTLVDTYGPQIDKLSEDIGAIGKQATSLTNMLKEAMVGAPTAPTPPPPPGAPKEPAKEIKLKTRGEGEALKTVGTAALEAKEKERLEAEKKRVERTARKKATTEEAEIPEGFFGEGEEKVKKEAAQTEAMARSPYHRFARRNFRRNV